MYLKIFLHVTKYALFLHIITKNLEKEFKKKLLKVFPKQKTIFFSNNEKKIKKSNFFLHFNLTYCKKKLLKISKEKEK